VILPALARRTHRAAITMIPAHEPPPLPAGWRHHEDRWNGFALDLPDAWRVVVDGTKVYALNGERAVLFWPLRTDEGPMEPLVERVVRELAGGDPSFEAWGEPEGQRARSVMFRRRGPAGGWLRGVIRVERRGSSAAVVRGFQAPEGEVDAARAECERVARSVRSVAAPRRVRTVDPSEGAWSVEHPEGWRVEGGVDRSRAQGGGIVVWRVEDPHSGAAVFNDGLMLPMQEPHGMMGWMGAMAGFGPSPMGWNHRPFCDAPTATREVLLPLARQRRPDVVLDGVAPDAEVERVTRAQMEEPARRLGGTAQSSTCLAYSRYSEGGSRWRECAVVVTWRVIPAGLGAFGSAAPTGYWFINVGPVLRAPAEVFDETLPLLSAIARSFRADTAWEHREMDRAGRRMAEDRARAEAQRAQMLRDTMDHIHRVDEEIVAHRQATTAEINRVGHNTVMGKEDVLDVDGRSTKVDTGYDTYWARDDRVFGSNSTELDAHLESDGWRRLKVF
jgi:hypothetical protein